MHGILRFSEAASLGMHAVSLLAREPGRVMTTRGIAERLEVSEAHLSKVLQRITRAGLVVSARGPNGGFRLADGSGDATLLEVYESIDGPLMESTCLLGRPVCEGSECILGGLLKAANREVRECLEGRRLFELAVSGTGG